MIVRVLGRTGVRVSAVSFGAGPVSGLMTGTDTDAQRATVAREIPHAGGHHATTPGDSRHLAQT